MTKVDKSQKAAIKYEQFLEKHTNLFILGKSKAKSIKKKKENASFKIPLRKNSFAESQKIKIYDKQY